MPEIVKGPADSLVEKVEMHGVSSALEMDLTCFGLHLNDDGARHFA